MRWKLLRRRLSVSAPRVIVRSHLPWPLRWAVAALAFGFSAALALWAFEFGKEIAGLEKSDKTELLALRDEVARLRAQSEEAQSASNTVGSLLRTEKAAQERLAQQVRQLEGERQELRDDLGFFERLLPAAGEGIQIRGLLAEAQAPTQLRYQMLVMQTGRNPAEFNGRFELLLAGTLDGKPWSQALPEGPKPLKLRQYTRVQGVVEHVEAAVVRSVQVRVLDGSGAVRSTQAIKL